MNKANAIKHVVLDFDGTCTQVPKIWKAYLDLYFKALPDAGFNVSPVEWSEACDAVRKCSPKAAWNSSRMRRRSGGSRPLHSG